MGYTTDFSGSWTVTPPLTPDQVAYLRAFSNQRGSPREPALAERMDDPRRLAVGLPIGPEGAYFTGALGHAGQDSDPSIREYNRPPAGQLGLWCQWAPTDDGTAIEWDGAEKFYAAAEWIEYLIEHFLAPWGRVLEGTVEWQGEDHEDIGRIVIAANVVTVQPGSVTYGDGMIHLTREQLLRLLADVTSA